MICQLIRFLVTVSLIVIGVSGHAYAHSYSFSGIEINHPYAQPTRPGMRNSVVYFRSIRNSSNVSERLLSATSSVAGRLEFHQVSTENSVMRMREVTSVHLLPGRSPSFRHGPSNEFHIMLVDLKQPLTDGDQFKIKLNFQNAGEREVVVYVQNLRQRNTEHNHAH